MPRVSYEQSVIDRIIRTAIASRDVGATWHDVFVDAQTAGYQGSESGLQKLVRAHAAASKPSRKKAKPSGFKNSAKAPEALAEPSNAFARTPAEPGPVIVGMSFRSAGSARKTETLESIQNRLPVLRNGAHYDRPISLFHAPFQSSRDGEIVAWSRILEKEEAVCVVNSHDRYPRGADILVDSTLNPPGSFLTVIHSTAATAGADAYPIGARLPVERRHDGTAFVAVRDIEPSTTLLLSNSPAHA